MKLCVCVCVCGVGGYEIDCRFSHVKFVSLWNWNINWLNDQLTNHIIKLRDDFFICRFKLYFIFYLT